MQLVSSGVSRNSLGEGASLTLDIEILGWCPVGSVLPHYHNKTTLWGRCFITSTSLTPHLFLLGWLKLNLILLLGQLRLVWGDES